DRGKPAGGGRQRAQPLQGGERLRPGLGDLRALPRRLPSHAQRRRGTQPAVTAVQTSPRAAGGEIGSGASGRGGRRDVRAGRPRLRGRFGVLLAGAGGLDAPALVFFFQVQAGGRTGGGGLLRGGVRDALGLLRRAL